MKFISRKFAFFIIELSAHKIFFIQMLEKYFIALPQAYGSVVSEAMPIRRPS